MTAHEWAGFAWFTSLVVIAGLFGIETKLSEIVRILRNDETRKRLDRWNR